MALTSMSLRISLYDTAWLAMIQAPGDPHHWLFPESYSYLLLQQNKDGMWPTYASQIDGILNTLGGLLALVKHQKSDSGSIENPSLAVWDLPSRIEKAREAVGSALRNWDVKQTIHVGFELLVPSLLAQLSNEGIVFEFECLSALTTLYHEKLLKFHPHMVASKSPTTLLHSLEALIGVVDFGLLKHHCTDYGGMFGSPASTAAYLSHSPEWDFQAQTYLQNVVCSYGSCGGVPSGFPAPVFEISWIISTLLASGFSIEDFQHDDLQAVTEYLKKAMHDQNGVLGFAPGFLPDADDTSRCLLSLTALGVQIDRSPLIRHFEGSSHFRTYQFERDPSVSANCNVLLALLTSPNVVQYATQINKAAGFLCTRWNANRLQDKWNLATEYTDMLLASALCQLLYVYDHGPLKDTCPDIIKNDVPIILIQLLRRTLYRQHENGSWQDSVERTSYAVLLIAQALKLPWHFTIREHAEDAFSKAKIYLEAHSNQWATGEYLWVEKVTFRYPILSETYCLAAVNSSVEKQAWTSDVEGIFQIDEARMQDMLKLFGRLPLLQGLSQSTVALAIYEAAMFTSRLKKVRLAIFPRDDMGISADKYLEYIPIAWITIHATNSFILSTDEMWEMMMMSMLNYQMDEYMEAVVAGLNESSLQVLKMIIGTDIQLNGGPWDASSMPPLSTGSSVGDITPPKSDSGSSPNSSKLEDVVEVISKYIRHVKQHNALLKSPESARLRVMQELDKYLLAHILHNEENVRLKEQKNGSQAPAGMQDPMPYYDWVHTTGAIDTSCPSTFAFFCCLISESGFHCLSSMDQKYAAREMCLHLATLCRQYNDYGSAERDEAEDNLNSLNFSEFAEEDNDQNPSSLRTMKAADEVSREKSLEKAKRLLMMVAGVERACVEACWKLLAPSLDEVSRTKMKTFIDVTDLFGQIYVERDIGSRLQK
ncbi:hypothetical protein BX600DRAFT_484952 [Xylariales sp. PMI_506]|nr:hypothetical protein BX600DRAFT_484952 [Xylariales sp. PMI_506]